MIHNFDTGDECKAVAALCLYATYRSRSDRFKIDKQVWDRVERFTKGAAKRARCVGEFIERLKPQLCCDSLSPRWCRSDVSPAETAIVERDENGMMDGIIVRSGEGQRDFMVRVVETCDQRGVLDAAYKQTSMVVALVRDRIEREKAAKILEEVFE